MEKFQKGQIVKNKETGHVSKVLDVSGNGQFAIIRKQGVLFDVYTGDYEIVNN